MTHHIVLKCLQSSNIRIDLIQHFKEPFIRSKAQTNYECVE